MGRTGPVPNRSEDLNRPRSRKGSDQQEVTKGLALPVTVPAPDPEWHPIALMLWDSLSKSGQAHFYQQSDWAFAYSICEDLSMYKKPFERITDAGEVIEYHKRSGQMLQTIYSAMSNLLVTEGDRRRVRLELEEPADNENPASVTVMNEYKQQLGLVPGDGGSEESE